MKHYFSLYSHVYSVDGYLEINDKKYVIEYNGCFVHNHQESCLLQHEINPNFDLESEKYRLSEIGAKVDEVIVLNECKWKHEQNTAEAQQFIQTRPLYHTWKHKSSIAAANIVPLIMSGKLKGLFEVDAYVPKNVRDQFHDVQPFFYQKEVTWDMIGDTMRNHFTQSSEQKKFKPHSLLLNVPFCQKLFLTHFYIKWLVEHGIIIHKVHRIVEYPLCDTPFRELGELICSERQKASDASASEQAKARADAWKLIGNSIYGQFCMRPTTSLTRATLT